MAVVGICTRWWQAQCMRCGSTWGAYLYDPGEDEPYCYLCGIHAVVTEEGPDDPDGIMILVRFKGA